MKKILVLVLSIIFLTGCGKDSFIGTWTTSYELPEFGTVTETYDFKEDGVCTRTLSIGSDIVEDCTYEWNEDKTQIRILWDSKISKDEFSTYTKNSKTEIVIGSRAFKKQS